MDSALLSLLGAFVLSLLGLFAFIWSLRQGIFIENPNAARTIFLRGESGNVDEPAVAPAARRALQEAANGWRASTTIDPVELHERVRADRSSAFVVFLFMAFAAAWLLVGTTAGLIASWKLHDPDWLVNDAWLTFGRIRSIHLNAVLYGWATNGCLGIASWLLPRLLRTTLQGALWMMLGGSLINIGVAAGIGAIAIGWTDGMEYLEIPWEIGIFIALGFVMIVVSTLFTLVNRQAEHLYVSVWYLVAALLWITILYVVGKLPGVHTGVAAGHDELVVRS